MSNFLKYVYNIGMQCILVHCTLYIMLIILFTNNKIIIRIIWIKIRTLQNTNILSNKIIRLQKIRMILLAKDILYYKIQVSNFLTVGEGGGNLLVNTFVITPDYPFLRLPTDY